MVRRRRFKGKPVDPEVLKWTLGLALVYKIDHKDLQEDEPEGDDTLDPIDEQAVEFEESRDRAQPKPKPGSEQLRHREEESQRAIETLLEQVDKLEKLAVSVRMMAPAGCPGIDTLARAYRDLDRLAQARPRDAQGQIGLARACKAFKERAEAYRAMFTSHPHDDDAISWALSERGSELCKGVLEDINSAMASDPPDAALYAGALGRLTPAFAKVEEHRAMAADLQDELSGMLDTAPLKAPKDYLSSIHDLIKKVDLALTDLTVKEKHKTLLADIGKARVGLIDWALKTHTCVSLPDHRGTLSIEAAIHAIGDVLGAGGLPFTREKKTTLKALSTRATGLRQRSAGHAAFESLAPAVAQLGKELTDLGAGLKGDKKTKTQTYVQKSNLTPIFQSDAMRLAATERGQMVTQAIKDIRTNPTWYDAAIEFIAGRLADGRPDHVHVAGGGNTLLNKGRVLLGFMTEHLDSRQSSQRKARPVFGRDTSLANLVDVAVEEGVIKEIVPDPED